MRAQIADAVAKGARALVDPANFPEDDGGAYLAPQILVDVDHTMEVMREESFGPVVGIMPVKDDAEAIALMNDCKYGLTASLWTQDAERAARIGREIETGTVFMNRADYLDPALCWTGCKETGRGGALSVIGFHNLTRPKSYHLEENEMSLKANWSLSDRHSLRRRPHRRDRRCLRRRRHEAASSRHRPRPCADGRSRRARCR